MAIKKKAGRISPVLMGDYDNTTVYRRLDWVKYGGTSYICKKNNTTGIAPSDPDRWQKIIDEANLNIPNYWQMTSKNGKGTFVQVGTKWIVTVPTMTQASDAPTAYWGVKLAAETEYTIQFGISNGTNDDSVYVNVSDTQGSHYQFSNIGNGDVIKYVRIPQDAWVWMKFQHYSNTTDTYAYLILEPVTPIDKHRILFEEASTRKNISSTDNLSTILGKIKKYFSDLKTVAFTGKYTDLSDKPISLKNPKSLKFTGGVTAEYDGSTEKSIAIPTSLKNPNTLNIKFNGTSQTSYDGSATKEVNITPAGISAVNTSTVLTTKEQISANTNANNVTGALVTKSLISDISQINSKLANLPIAFIRSNVHLAAQGVIKITITHNIGLNKQYGVWITPYFANVHPGTTWSERFISCVKNYAVSNLQANSFDIDFFLTEQTDIYAELICLVYTY
ncbi:hypothetical protein C804_01136 [Lachnospiraceae bacterium A4]|nr:hypothetical protein C804_01136 [Lachnospiraceae bacterium A4]